jgi:gamma-glutamylcyclotransferase
MTAVTASGRPVPERLRDRMLYFAYGSNMSVRRMQRRVRSACALDTAALRGHRLAFHKVGRDGSAKCDVVPSTRSDELVHGVLYRMALRHKIDLDEHEGLGRGYAEKRVVVIAADGMLYEAFLYYATHVDRTLRPFDWYREHVLRGAREHGLPSDYIARIQAVETSEDPDTGRHRIEMAIYR